MSFKICQLEGNLVDSHPRLALLQENHSYPSFVRDNVRDQLQLVLEFNDGLATRESIAVAGCAFLSAW